MKGSGAASEKRRKSRKSVPHLLLCFFKAFRNKVNLLESCNEAFLLAGDLWIKRLDFGTARERVLSNTSCVITCQRNIATKRIHKEDDTD